MAEAIVMPKAGITVEACVIGVWEKRVGDRIEEGDILFSYETDKAVFQCEATASGELLEIFFEEGDEVPCLSAVCVVGEKGEDCTAFRPRKAAPPPAQNEKSGELREGPVSTAAVPAAAADGAMRISPRARRLAERAGADAALAVGTGPQNRILERDIRRLLTEGPAQRDRSGCARAGEYVDSRLSGIRKTIARAMMQSLHNTAQLTHDFSFDATQLLQDRAGRKAMGGEQAGVTMGDMILYVVSRTLLAYPELNAHMLDDETIRRYQTVHLGVAVDTPRGLLVPVIRHAEHRSLLELSGERRRLAKAAVSGAISPDELTGGTFTVSNLGAFGVESFTPILNPPQTGIIGVCGLVERPRSRPDGGIELYPSMKLSLTYDHRAIDGAPASRFMQEVCKKLEEITALFADE